MIASDTLKYLPITTEFTLDYLQDLKDFNNLITRHLSTIYFDYTLHESLSKLRDDVSGIIKLIKKNPKYSGEISIPSFCLPYNNIKARKHNFKLIIGGIINIEEGRLKTQSICFSVIYHTDQLLDSERARVFSSHEYEAGAHVIRKFHFDIDRGIIDQERPLSHLQYGGSFKNDHYNVFQDLGDLDYKLFAAMDDPRLPNIPYGFISCLDIIFRTFSSPATILTKERSWVDQVVNNERKWLIPFFESALKNLKTLDNETFYQFMSHKA